MSPTTRLEAIHAGLLRDGVTPADADRVTARLHTIAKRRRQSTVARITRNRKAVTGPRADAADALATFFRAAAKDLAKQIIAGRDALDKLAKDGATDDVGDDDTADPADVEAILADLDFSDWDSVRESLDPLLVSVSQDGVRVAFDQIDYSPTSDLLDQVNEQAVAWARDRAAELVGKRYTDDGDLIDNPSPGMAITESTREMLRSSVASAIEDGLSVADLSETLADSYAFSETRATAIAQYEMASADVQGNLMAYRDSGQVSGKEWALGSEHDVDDECDDAANMGVVDLDDDFGGIGDPPAHPGCDCDVLPVLAGDADDAGDSNDSE